MKYIKLQPWPKFFGQHANQIFLLNFLQRVNLLLNISFEESLSFFNIFAAFKGKLRNIEQDTTSDLT